MLVRLPVTHVTWYNEPSCSSCCSSNLQTDCLVADLWVFVKVTARQHMCLYYLFPRQCMKRDSHNPTCKHVHISVSDTTCVTTRQANCFYWVLAKGGRQGPVMSHCHLVPVIPLVICCEPETGRPRLQAAVADHVLSQKRRRRSHSSSW